MTKLGSKIFGKTEGIKPRERTEPTPTRIKTSPGMFLDTQHRAAKAEAEVAALRNRKVKISDLVIVPGRKRQLTAQEFAELKANLEAFPLINPITIRVQPSGNYELVAGHNRVEAFVELGRSEIEANVIDLIDEQVIPAAFYSNLLSPSLPDYEKYLGFKQLQEATGKSQSELASESGVSKTMISMLFAFDQMGAASHVALSAQPQLVSATLAGKLRNLHNVDEAVAKLASGEITLQQVVSVASATEGKATPQLKSAPVIVKRGKQRFAEISHRGATAVIKLADASLMPALLLKLETLMRDESVRQEKSA